jgi:hypothetical protein
VTGVAVASSFLFSDLSCLVSSTVVVTAFSSGVDVAVIWELVGGVKKEVTDATVDSAGVFGWLGVAESGIEKLILLAGFSAAFSPSKIDSRLSARRLSFSRSLSNASMLEIVGLRFSASATKSKSVTAKKI